MTDLLGPANAPNAATVRPADTRVFPAGDTWFVDCSRPGANDGTIIQAVVLNELLAQIRSVIRAGNVPVNNADDNMLLEAIHALAPPAAAANPSPQMTGDVTTPAPGSGVTTIAAGAVTAAKMAAGAAVGNLGYTPVNRAGDSMTGSLQAAAFMLSGTGLSFYYVDTIAPPNSKIFTTSAASGTWSLKTLNDSYGGAMPVMQVASNGNAPTASFVAPTTFTAAVTINTSIAVPTMPAGDSSLNAASTAFVTNALAGAFAAGKLIAWADSTGQVAGGTLNIPRLTGAGTPSPGYGTATVTFTNPRPNSNYAVVGFFGSVMVPAFNTSGTPGSVSQVDVATLIKPAQVSKTTTGFTLTYPKDSNGNPLTDFQVTVYQ